MGVAFREWFFGSEYSKSEFSWNRWPFYQFREKLKKLSEALGSGKKCVQKKVQKCSGRFRRIPYLSMSRQLPKPFRGKLLSNRTLPSFRFGKNLPGTFFRKKVLFVLFHVALSCFQI